jgi:hypothetical protein
MSNGQSDKARVIEEGMNGRTTAFDDATDSAELNGALGAELLGPFKAYIEEPGLMLV